jgi:hypothetical protein
VIDTLVLPKNTFSVLSNRFDTRRFAPEFMLCSIAGRDIVTANAYTSIIAEVELSQSLVLHGAASVLDALDNFNSLFCRIYGWLK